MSGPDAFDAAPLRAALSDALDAPVTDLTVRHDGLNLILAVSTGEGTYVVRRPNKFREKPYMNALADEYAVMEGLAETAVPTPEPVLYREDAPGIDGPFYLMEHLDGEAVALGTDLPERFRTPAARADIADAVVDTLADVHALPVAEFADAAVRFTPREMVVEARERIASVAAATRYDATALQAVGDRLESLVPDDSPTAVVHGDYRPGNVLVAGDADPRLSGVLDWETTTISDPLTDLGYLLVRWRDDDDPAVELDDIEATCDDEETLQDLREMNAHGLSPFTGRAGSPSRARVVARYEDRTGGSFEHERFYVALAAYLLASVWLDTHETYVAAGDETNWPAYVDYATGLAELVLDGDWTV